MERGADGELGISDGSGFGDLGVKKFCEFDAFSDTEDNEAGDGRELVKGDSAVDGAPREKREAGALRGAGVKLKSERGGTAMYVDGDTRTGAVDVGVNEEDEVTRFWDGNSVCVADSGEEKLNCSIWSVLRHVKAVDC